MDNWDKVPPQDNTFSQEGTTAHEVAAAILENRKPNPKECPAQINNDMLRHGWDYAEYVEYLKGDRGVLLVEKKFPLWYMPERNGKIDAAVFSTGRLDIVDYKYGEGITVSPVNNLQGAIYARAVVEDQYSVGPLDSLHIFIHIYQPRGRNAEDSPAHVWETTWREIKEMTDELVSQPAAAIRVLSSGQSFGLKFAPSEKACQWCPAKGFCTERSRHLTESVNALTPLRVERETPLLPKAGTLTIDQRIAIEKHGDAISKWIKDVQDYNLQSMKAGTPMPGFKLVMSRGGNRYWSDPAQAAKLLVSTTILKRAEVIEEKVIGPAAAEKLLGKNTFPVALTNLIAKAPGSPCIAPEDDKRQSINANLLDGLTNLDDENILS